MPVINTREIIFTIKRNAHNCTDKIVAHHRVEIEKEKELLTLIRFFRSESECNAR